MSSCPNINSPEWKSLVNKIGENNAWREFLANNEIPSADNYDIIESASEIKEQQTIKPGVEELFNSNSELANIGTQEQYSQYLNSIFPDSQVKDIVYHGGNLKNIVKDITWEYPYKGVYFSTNINKWKEYRGKSTTIAVLNAKNPLMGYANLQKLQKIDYDSVNKILNNLELNTLSSNTGEVFHGDYLKVKFWGSKLPTIKVNNTELSGVTSKFYKRENNEWAEINRFEALDLIFQNKLGGDSVISNEKESEQIVVFEPEQIHILGNEQDIEGFKKFVDGKTTTTPVTKEKNILYSIKTKSVEEIAKGLNTDLVRSEQQIKYSGYIKTMVLNLLGDIGPGKKLNMSPNEAFKQTKEKFIEINNNIALSLNSYVKSEEDLQTFKSSELYNEMLEFLPVLDYVNTYKDLQKAAAIYNNVVSKFDSYVNFVKID